MVSWRLNYAIHSHGIKINIIDKRGLTLTDGGCLKTGSGSKKLFKVSRISKILGRELNVLEAFKAILTQNASLETTRFPEAGVSAQPGLVSAAFRFQDEIKATPNNLEAIQLLLQREDFSILLKKTLLLTLVLNLASNEQKAKAKFSVGPQNL